jgi:hypothetical protein
MAVVNTAETETPEPEESGSGSSLGSHVRFWVSLFLVAVVAVAGGMMMLQPRYGKAMPLALKELGPQESAECSENLSGDFEKFGQRRLTLIQTDERHFDFVLESDEPHVANVTLKHVDVGLLIPALPAWCQADETMARIALSDRQWNHQRVIFDVPSSDVDVSGGNGVELANLTQVALTRNCLDGGPWEVQLLFNEENGPAVYYHAWFNFPKTEYQRIWERNTGQVSPSKSDEDLGDTWLDPAGTVVAMDLLRTVKSERQVLATPVRLSSTMSRNFMNNLADLPSITALASAVLESDGESDFFLLSGRSLGESTWGQKYWQNARFEAATLREIQSPLRSDATLSEIELWFASEGSSVVRFLVGGVDLNALPIGSADNEDSGLRMPVGIGAPPFEQKYVDLVRLPPQENPFYSLLIDRENRWIDHHSASVSGVRLYRDPQAAGVVHLHLIGNDRSTTIGQFRIDTQKSPSASTMAEQGNSSVTRQ